MKLGSYKKLAIVVTSIIFAGCSSLDNPVIRTFNRAIGVDQQQNSRFDPNYQYLRVVKDGRVVYLALGNVDSGTAIWYSAGREVLRLKDGRIAGASGLVTEWRNVVLPAFPSWTVLAQSKSPYKWTRIRDVMPGYRYGVTDELTLSRIAAPQDTQLAGIAPGSLTWFEEDDTSPVDKLPPARYAFDAAKHEIVYGETCLAETFCFSWQRWPAGAP